MNHVRAIGIGAVIWMMGVSVFLLSHSFSIIEDTEQQANVLLSISIIPLVWYGTRYYYKKEIDVHGYWVGLIFFLTSGVLDALITVPFFMIPEEISYAQFFTDPGFWLIGFEFLGIAVLYWYIETTIKKKIKLFKSKS